MLTESRSERWHQAQGFIVAVLYRTLVDEEVPIRAWLGDHLCRVFDFLVYGRRWDRPIQFLFSEPQRLAPDAPTGRRGKRSGPSLEDYAHWVYRLDVAEPRWTPEALAIERLHALGDPERAPRDPNDITDRVDTKTVRYGYEKAKRLLELTVPPERWTAYFNEMWPDRRGKIPS